MTTATARPLTQFAGTLTPLLVRMIEERGITTIDELREQRDHLEGQPGYNPRTMRLIDRALEEAPMTQTVEVRRTYHGYVQRSEVAPWPGLNPRTEFDDGALAELAASIREKGLLEPILLQDLEASKYRDGTPMEAARKDALATGTRYWVVAGERRFRASAIAELDEIPASIGVYTEAEALDIALIENLQRADISVLDEARAFQRRLELGDMTQEALAERIGKSPSYVANHLRLLALPDGIQKLIREGVLMPSHARDFILPFQNIPAGKWKKLTAEVEKEIRGDRESLFGDEKLRGEDVRLIVGHVARDLSHSLDKNDYGKDAPQFDPKKHSECGCNGPAIERRWGRGTETRCFNDAWWNEQQKAAIERKKEREKKAKLKAEKLAAEGGPRKTYADLGAVRKAHGWDVVTIGRESGFEHGHVYDLEKIPADKLVFAKGHAGLELVCTDRRAASAASVSKERNELLAARKQEAAQADLAEARTKRVGQAIAYRLLVDDLLYMPEGQFAQMLENDLGIDLYPDEGEFDLSVYDDATIATWVNLFVMKKERGEIGQAGEFVRRGESSIAKAVDKELAKKYSPALRAIFAARDDTPSTSGKSPAKPNNKKNGRARKAKQPTEVEATAARVGREQIVSGTEAAARRAAEAVRMSGIFNR